MAGTNEWPRTRRFAGEPVWTTSGNCHERSGGGGGGGGAGSSGAVASSGGGVACLRTVELMVPTVIDKMPQAIYNGHGGGAAGTVREWTSGGAGGRGVVNRYGVESDAVGRKAGQRVCGAGGMMNLMLADLIRRVELVARQHVA